MTKRKIGRPSAYNDAIAKKLCVAISTNSAGLRTICSRNRKFPNVSTIYRWLSENSAFRERYARAREFQAQALFDEIIEIADKVQLGTVTKVDRHGRKEKRIADMVDRARLRIDTRKWSLSKLLPKKYGHRVDVNQSGDNLPALIAAMQKRSEEIGPPEGAASMSEEEETVQ
jgi:hypothetical protein